MFKIIFSLLASISVNDNQSIDNNAAANITSIDYIYDDSDDDYDYDYDDYDDYDWDSPGERAANVILGGND